MGNELIINALAARLDEKYPGVLIYAEDVPEEFTRPCFYIQTLDTLQQEGLQYSARRVYPYVLHYFPEDGKGKYHRRRECRAVGDRLLDILNYLPFDGVYLRGCEMSYKVTEDAVLQLYVRYNLRYRREDLTEYMQTLAIEKEIKEDGK